MVFGRCELFLFKWIILYYMNYTSIIKKTKKNQANKILMFRLHLKPVKSESLWVGPGHSLSKNLPWCLQYVASVRK